MVTKEQIDAEVMLARHEVTARIGGPCQQTRSQVIASLADENATLRAQLVEAERRGREDMRQSFLDVLRAWSSEDGGVFTESRAPSLYERLTALMKEPTATPPSDQDVRAALADAILEADGDATAYGIADAILSDPLLGKLLRGGR